MPRVKKSATSPELSGSVQSLVLAMDLLEAIAGSEDPKRVTDLAEQFSTTKARVFRHLRTLTKQEYVVHDPKTGQYRSGPKLILLGQMVLEKLSLVNEARPIMRELCQQLGHSIGLSQVIGSGLHTVEVVRGTSPFSITTLRGTRQVTHATALGKIALAFGAREISQDIDSLTLEQITPHTITDRDKLKREIASIAKRGWAVSPNELNIGINALAAPIFDGRRRFVGALAALDLIHLLPEKPSPQQISAVTDAARQISQRLGYT